MRWMMLLCTALSLSVGASFAQGPADVDLLKAMQRTNQKIIQQNEASVACILVSRSDQYKKSSTPGKLGGFDRSEIKVEDKNLSKKDADLLIKKLDLSDPSHIPPAYGSGVVIDADGLILTNYHVVQDATKIYVRLPGGKGSYADIHAADSRCDLAVLKLLAPGLHLKPITFGDADKVEQGQFVLTLSNPFATGFRDGKPSASWGIISNIRRRAPQNIKEEERIKPFHLYGTLLQTDARLNLGCSGGALFNLSGEMVGLITSMAGIQGGETPGGFALPINPPTRSIIDVLKRGEEVDYGFLGVSFEPRAGSDGQLGVPLLDAYKGSPARNDGKLQGGDVLLEVNGQPIRDIEDIYLNVGMHLAGSKVTLKYKREFRERVAEVTLAKLLVPGKHISSSLGSRPYFRGMRVDYTSIVAQQMPRWPYIPDGVLISDVQAESSADRSGLKAGDVVTQVNQTAVKTPAAFYRAIAGALGPVELTVINAQQETMRINLKK